MPIHNRLRHIYLFICDRSTAVVSMLVLMLGHVKKKTNVSRRPRPLHLGEQKPTGGTFYFEPSSPQLSIKKTLNRKEMALILFPFEFELGPKF